MFTGIVTAVGTVVSSEPGANAHRVAVDAVDLAADGAVQPGDSIAVNGVCLTVTERRGTRLDFDVSAETLACTTLGELSPGARVNLEQALLPTTRLGGHLVSGHVDGVGTVVDRRRDGPCERFRIQIPQDIAKYVVHKGSLSVDGVSLTVNGLSDRFVDLTIIPHTLQVTNLGMRREGDRVNIEVDVIARYLERLLFNDEDGGRAARPLDNIGGS